MVLLVLGGPGAHSRVLGVSTGTGEIVSHLILLGGAVQTAPGKHGINPTFIASCPFCLSHFLTTGTDTGGPRGVGDSPALPSAPVLCTLTPSPCQDPAGKLCVSTSNAEITTSNTETRLSCYQERVTTSPCVNSHWVKKPYLPFSAIFSFKSLTRQENSPSPLSHRPGDV